MRLGSCGRRHSVKIFHADADSLAPHDHMETQISEFDDRRLRRGVRLKSAVVTGLPAIKALAIRSESGGHGLALQVK